MMATVFQNEAYYSVLKDTFFTRDVQGSASSAYQFVCEYIHFVYPCGNLGDFP